jgi:hypothetical protein
MIMGGAYNSRSGGGRAFETRQFKFTIKAH